MRKIAAVLIAVILLTAGCTGRPTEASRTGFALDTVVSITVYDRPSTEAEQILTVCFDELERLESLLSVTREDSDIDRINRAVGETVTVSEETAEMLTLSAQVAQLSDGAFDITIRPLSALWDFTSDTSALPNRDSLAAACGQVDYRQLTVSDTTVTLTGGSIEPGGVAKGYIADRLRDTLTEQGVTSALIDLGGNIVVCGDKNGDRWRIGIKDPANVSSLRAIVQVRDCSVVTSGTYERGFTLDGVRYHHLLDPQTGMPVQNGLASVTVVAESSALADALSTACFVLGEEGARELLKSFPGTQALFIYENGTLTVTDGLYSDQADAAVAEYRLV